jgi:hypothetical protein
MCKNEFLNWLDGLETQTLTDELKEEIKEKAEDAFDEEIKESCAAGYTTCKDLIKDFIDDDL